MPYNIDTLDFKSNKASDFINRQFGFYLKSNNTIFGSFLNERDLRENGCFLSFF